MALGDVRMLALSKRRADVGNGFKRAELIGFRHNRGLDQRARHSSATDGSGRQVATPSWASVANNAISPRPSSFLRRVSTRGVSLARLTRAIDQFGRSRRSEPPRKRMVSSVCRGSRSSNLTSSSRAEGGPSRSWTYVSWEKPSAPVTCSRAFLGTEDRKIGSKATSGKIPTDRLRYIRRSINLRLPCNWRPRSRGQCAA
jgi:hypothetical protein